MRILVAEDERITRVSLARQLQQWGHEVVEAEDGELAWAAIQQSGFDIVLTDWDMPRCSGVELIQRIRGQSDPAFVYIVMLTGRNEKADIVRGIEAGADDFVAKPFDREELRVRLLAGERVVRLERTLSRQNAELRIAGERMRKDLQAAARVQEAMLPKGDVSTSTVRAAWKYAPSEELAGDAIGLHLLQDRWLVAYVLDVSGHGVPAALLSVTAMHELSPVHDGMSVLRGNDPGGDPASIQRPGLVATQLNRRFRSGESAGLFMTMVLCMLDTQTGLLHYTCAGHFAPLLIRDGSMVTLDAAGGLPLAVMDEATYDDATVALQPGDRYILFSDGIIEQPAAAREPREDFGQERFEHLLLGRSAAESIDSVVNSTVHSLADWAGGKSFKDDVSLVAVEWIGPTGT